MAYGSKGQDLVSSFLPYVSFNNVYVLPTYHMLLHGVLRKFWELACKKSIILSPV